MAWRTGMYGVACAYDEQRPISSVDDDGSSVRRNSSSNRLLPSPASPVTVTNRPYPARTSSNASTTLASSRSRPVNSVRPPRPAIWSRRSCSVRSSTTFTGLSAFGSFGNVSVNGRRQPEIVRETARLDIRRKQDLVGRSMCTDLSGTPNGTSRNPVRDRRGVQSLDGRLSGIHRGMQGQTACGGSSFAPTANQRREGRWRRERHAHSDLRD